MKVLVFDHNLFWSSRLAKSLRALGHEAVVVSDYRIPATDAEAAIVNLSTDDEVLGELVAKLREIGCYVIGHAGHKERTLWDAGATLGCDAVVSNGTITHRLDDVLNPVLLRVSNPTGSQ